MTIIEPSFTSLALLAGPSSASTSASESPLRSETSAFAPGCALGTLAAGVLAAGVLAAGVLAGPFAAGAAAG
ncbi:MAG: hypothetical protein ABIZ91_09930 [Gemmatimonadaceae bacterium]